ncbi:hypothetical protein [Microbacterium sp.]|uniref:hypothetical protein n=1 Tax=Microbacterium sp. TaxID=51671 RepID=UPI003F70FA66
MTAEGDYAGIRLVAIDDPTELAAVEALRARLGKVPAAVERWNRVAKVRPKPGSQIALDDIASGWRQVSHSVSHQLNHAADTLHALTVLIPPEGPLRLPSVAHYPVARSALEAASLALWIVAPDDPRERIERHLRNAWRELCADAEMRAVMIKGIEDDPTLGLTSMLDRSRKQIKVWKRKHVVQIRTTAKRVGVDDPTLSDRRVGFAEIVRESTAATGMRGMFGEIVWREISGLSHPSMLRSITSMDREEIVDHGDGTLGAMFTSNAGKAKYSVEAAHLAFREAIEIFGDRKIRRGDPASYVPPKVHPVDHGGTQTKMTA